MKFFTPSTLLLALFMMNMALGCTQADVPQKNPTNQIETTTQEPDPEQPSDLTETLPESEIVASANSALRPGEQVWTSILPGEEAHELMFTEEGTLLYQGTVIASDLQVSGSDAKRLLISPPSPSGKYHLFQACDGLDESALCWAEFLVNKAEGGAQPVSLSKYGVMHWAQWSENEKYALFPYSTEGTFMLIALDLETGESSSYFDEFCNLDLDSFRWVDNRAFQLQVFDFGDAGLPCNDSPRWLNVDIAEFSG